MTSDEILKVLETQYIPNIPEGLDINCTIETMSYGTAKLKKRVSLSIDNLKYNEQIESALIFIRLLNSIDNTEHNNFLDKFIYKLLDIFRHWTEFEDGRTLFKFIYLNDKIHYFIQLTGSKKDFIRFKDILLYYYGHYIIYKKKKGLLETDYCLNDFLSNEIYSKEWVDKEKLVYDDITDEDNEKQDDNNLSKKVDRLSKEVDTLSNLLTRLYDLIKSKKNKEE